MKSLFNTTDNAEIINRINQLKSSTSAQWGKMNVSQMLSHAQTPLRVAFGEIQLKRGLMGILFGKILKKQLVGDTPFKKNMPTDKQFIVTGYPDFEEEKKKLIQLVSRFSSSGPKAITQNPHPFFGKMTAEEWDRLQWKHLDHHLEQFGV